MRICATHWSNNVNISHHLDDATVMAHAAGTLPYALSTVAESHLEFCATCRATLKNAREIGGSLLTELEPVEVSAARKEAILAEIGSATLHRLPLAQPFKRGEMPMALQEVLRVERFDDIAWRKSAPGIQIYKLPKLDGETGFFGLLRIEPGHTMPEHGHGGLELTLVLKGAYHDELGHFARGDIADHDESIEHQPVVVGDEACICLVANQAATRFRSWPARIMQKFIGI